MLYKIRSTSAVVSINNLRIAFPCVGFAESPNTSFLDSLGIDPVVETVAPSLTEFQRTVSSVENVAGTLTQVWTIESLSSEEISAALTPRKVFLVAKIDADADAIYALVIGNRLSEYLQANTDALAYIAAGYTGTVPSCVQAWATAKAQTAQWAADDINTTATAWKTAQAAIRASRLAGKEAVRNAATFAAANTAMETWNGFVVYIKSVLGV